MSTALKPGETERIRKTPGVMGGEACVGNTRLSVWILVGARRLGFTDQELLRRYDLPLAQEDLDAAWQYAADHSEEIEDAIRRNTGD